MNVAEKEEKIIKLNDKRRILLNIVKEYTKNVDKLMTKIEELEKEIEELLK